MKNLARNVGILLLMCSCQEPEESPTVAPPVEENSDPLLDLTTIAGGTVADVENQLGSPGSSTKVAIAGNEYPKNTYREGEVAIIFVHDQATWLTIYPSTELPFQKTSLTALGLPVSEPSFTHPLSLMRWIDYQNLREINFFANPDITIRYISICVTHCP